MALALTKAGVGCQRSVRRGALGIACMPTWSEMQPPGGHPHPVGRLSQRGRGGGLSRACCALRLTTVLDCREAEGSSSPRCES